MSLVSVVVACYNEEACIASCLESLLDQTWPRLEILVVDDGSTDATREVVSRYPVRLLEGRHQGAAGARNLGARAARGEVLLFLDADMEFAPDYVERMVEPILAGECRGTYHLDERVANPDNVWSRCWSLHHGLPIDRRLPEDFPRECPVFRAILREEFLRVGGYDDTGYGEDTTVAAKLGYMARAVEGAVCFHHNPSSPGDVFASARWIGKGNHTPRTWAYALRRLPPVSFWRGLCGAFRHRLPAYLLFHLVYDAGILCGLALAVMTGGHAK